jgi:hypothetical protein
MMSLVIVWCLSGTCKEHEIPLPEVVTPMTCIAWAQAKIVELKPTYPEHEAARFACVKGVKA